MNRRFFLRQTLFALPATLTLFAFGCNTTTSQTDTTTTAASPGANASPAAGSGEKIKIGFIVKSATEEWFQTEWKFAQQAADKNGFELVKLEASDAEKTLSALDNLAAQGAKGVIICAPDVKLGSSIVSKCKEANMKLMSVDDRLVGADGKPLADVPHLGISAYNIGKKVGQAISDEMKARKWNPAEVGAL